MLKFAVVLVCTLVFSLSAADKLPEFGSEAWKKLPGVSEVIRDAGKGDIYAKFLMALAAENAGNPSLMEELLRDQRSYDVLQDDAKMFVVFQKYAEKDFYLALDMLAAKYYQMQMIDTSMKLWKKAADQGCRISQYNLGLLILNQNKDKKKIPSETLKLWKASADQEYVPALKDMGIFWITGVITGKPDFNKAVFYLEKAARKKHVQAMFLLGEIYEKGLNGKVDKDLAIKYYKAVADAHPYWKEQAEGNGREAMNSSKNNNTTAK